MINVNILLDFAIVVGIFSIFVLGLNLHWGYTGLLNFGHVGFFMVGAYTTLLITMSESAATSPIAIALDLPFLVGIMGAIVLAGLAGVVIGIPAIELEKEALAILTLAFATVLHAIISGETWLAGGTYGMSNIPKPFASLTGTAVILPIPGFTMTANLWKLAYLGVVLLFLLLVYVFVQRLVGSPFGRVLKGVREDEEAVKIFGKNTARFKVYSFTFGAAIAGIAGALWVHYTGSITPNSFLPTVTFTAWVAIILGGMGNNRGVIIGAAVLFGSETLTYYLPSIPGYPNLMISLRLILIGLLLIGLMRWRPEGLFSEKLPEHLQ